MISVDLSVLRSTPFLDCKSFIPGSNPGGASEAGSLAHGGGVWFIDCLCPDDEPQVRAERPKRALAENLWAATELLAKAELLTGCSTN